MISEGGAESSWEWDGCFLWYGARVAVLGWILEGLTEFSWEEDLVSFPLAGSWEVGWRSSWDVW